VIRMLRHLRNRLATGLLTRPSSAFIPAAILALSLASAERTYTGMRNFTGNEHSINAIAVSILITFGVQALMLVLAWRLGDAYASHSSRGSSATTRSWPSSVWFGFWKLVTCNFVVANLLLILSFGVCAAICMFFSFDAFFQVINSDAQRKIVAGNEALEVVRAIDVDLTKALQKAVDETGMELVSGTFWDNYASRVRAVKSAADDPDVAQAQERRETERRQQANARTAGLQAKLDQATALREQKAAAAAKLKRELDDADKAQKQVEADAKALSDKIKAEERELEEILSLLRKEDANGNGERKHGRGPVYRDYQRQAEILKEDLLRLKNEAKQFDPQLQAAKNKRDAKDTEYQASSLALKQATSAAEALQKERSLQDVSEAAPVATAAANAAKGLEGLLVGMQNEPSSEHWKSLTTGCGTVLELLGKSPDTRDRAASLDCSTPGNMAELAANLSALETRRRDFKAKCSAIDTEAAFGNLIEHGKQCLQTAQLKGAEVTALRERLNRVSEEQDESAHTFTRTIFAFQRGDKLAYLSALLALGLDGLILLCGLWGARTRVSPLTRRDDDETASEIDEDARMAMAVETRPESLWPSGGWSQPAEVYKARVFLRHIEPHDNPTQPEYAYSISTANLNETERGAVKGIIALGPFTRFAGDPARPATWLVSDRLIKFLQRIVASHDSLRRLYDTPEVSNAGAPEQSQAASRPLYGFAPSSYWANVAQAANDRGPERTSEVAEEEYLNAGFNALRANENTADAVRAEDETDRSASA
jgi:hypothetical protein